MKKDRKQKRQTAHADPEQSRRFIEAARELGADQSEEAFDEALRKVARAPVEPRRKKRKPESGE